MIDDLGITGAPTATPAAAPAPSPSPLSKAFWSQQGIGPGVEKLYEQYAAPPLSTVTGYGLGGAWQNLRHPIQTIAYPFQQAAAGKPIESQVSPETAQSLGQLAPQTLPQAYRDVMSLYGPGGWANVGLQTVGSGIVGGLTGKAPVEEAARGLLQTAPFEAAGWVGQKIAGGLRTAGESKIGRQAMDKFGGLIKEKLPFLQRLSTFGDFVRAFGSGDKSEGVRLASKNLERVKQDLGSRLGPNDLFQIRVPNFIKDLKDAAGNPVLDVFGKPVRGKGEIIEQSMPFHEADATLTKLNKQGFDPRFGRPRGNFNAADYRDLSHANRKHMIDRMNQIQKGTGDSYGRARKMFDSTDVWTRVFNQPSRLFNQQGVMDQRGMIDQVEKHAEDLGRYFTTDELEGLKRALRHGATEGFDIPSEPGKWGMRFHLGLSPHALPTPHRSFGRSFEPVGTEMPPWMKLRRPFEGIERAAQVTKGPLFVGQEQPNNPTPSNPGPSSSAGRFSMPGLEGTASAAELPPPDTNFKPQAMHDIEAMQNRELAPTPSGADRAGQITQSLRRSRTPTDVSKDLNRGVLSTDEVKKLLQRTSSTDPAARVAGVPLPDLMGAAETATPQEKQILVPLIQARLQKELPKLANKTMQAKLAQRFKMLQAEAGPSFPPT